MGTHFIAEISLFEDLSRVERLFDRIPLWIVVFLSFLNPYYNFLLAKYTGMMMMVKSIWEISLSQLSTNNIQFHYLNITNQLVVVLYIPRQDSSVSNKCNITFSLSVITNWRSRYQNSANMFHYNLKRFM